jgi:hypothetical protein
MVEFTRFLLLHGKTTYKFVSNSLILSLRITLIRRGEGMPVMIADVAIEGVEMVGGYSELAVMKEKGERGE